MTKKAMYEQIKEIDPEVPSLPAFFNFMKKLENNAKDELALMRSVTNDIAHNDMDLVRIGIKQAMALGNLTLAQSLEDVQEMTERGEKLPWKVRETIMRWWKDSGDLIFRDQTLKLKVADTAMNAEKLSILSRAARSGNLSDDDVQVVEGEINQVTDNDDADSETLQQDESEDI